jgi:predicted enzyme related to lactoylglutathione lyase
MKFGGILGAALAFAALTALPADAQPTTPAAKGAAMPAPVVFFDISAPELAKQAAFYKAVFDWDVDAGGGFAVPVASPLHANLRVETAGEHGAPLAERVIYIGVPDINATLAKITANGGSVVFPRMVVPGVVILALFKDPAGNRMGVVELGPDGAPVVPPAK